MEMEEHATAPEWGQEEIKSLLDSFGIEHDEFWNGIKDFRPKCWISESPEGETRMLVTDGDDGAALIASDYDIDPDTMIVVFPVVGAWCGIPFDFIRTFEGIINDKRPKSERRRTRSRRHRVTH